MDIGGDLRRARTARKLSIDGLARTTKIPPRVLLAIESGAFETIPRGLFTRGYLRAYAHAVGLDPEIVVREYREQYEAPEIPTEAAGTAPGALDSHKIDEETRGSRQANILQVALIVIVAVGYLVSLRYPRQSSPLAAPSPTVVAAASAASESPAPAAQTPPAEAAVGTSGTMNAAAGAPIEIDIHATGPCWVDASAGGKRFIARLMNPDERQTLKVDDELTLRIGDPAAFAYMINGVPGQPLGLAGQPKTVRINRQNYATFLGARAPAGVAAKCLNCL